MSVSRASTVTLGREHHSADSQSNVIENVVPEDVPDDLWGDPESGVPPKRLIIAVDFGTTYSAVSYVALEEGESAQLLELDRIRSVQNFPDDWNFGSTGNRMKSEVPTEIIYPLDRHFREKEDLAAADEEEEQNGPAVEIHAVGDAAGFNSGGNLTVSDEHSDEDADLTSIDESSSFRWGYEVHEAWSLPATHSDPNNQALSRFKLLLDSSPMTETIRNQLRPTIHELKRRKIINNPHHVIVDFLTCLLRHSKSEVRNAGFDETYRTEFVLSVPAIWSQKACRDMQIAMAKAVERARFEGVGVQNNSIENLFIVSEPEAAAAYVLATRVDISPGDTFVLLDAGGGTVDANTYTVSMATPLRLTREVVPPGGGLYGSSYLNEGFRRLLHDLLADEVYLEQGGNTINGHIEKIMIDNFEHRLKRSFDYYKAKGGKDFPVPGLRDNPRKGFKKGCVHISADKIRRIFLRCLEGIASVMEDQIKAAREQGAQVEVLLIGGFAESVSLGKYLQQRLDQFCKENNCGISLIIPPQNIATAVASGAVLRASNKEMGPRRHARSSYGILRTEPFGEFPEHEGLKASYDQHDGLPYLVGTIDWVLKLGDEVEPVWKCRPFLCSHTFDCWPIRPLICKEVLYVSDRSTESHYQRKHPKNAGAEKVGEIIVDFTFLRDQGLIHPIDGGVNEKGKRVGRRHYRVTYTMSIWVVGRDLRCLAVYNGQIRQKCRLNIAPAFRPGVK